MKPQFMLDFKDCNSVYSNAGAVFIELSRAAIHLFKAKVCLPVLKNKTIENFSLQTIYAFSEANTVSFSYGRLHINRGFQTA